MAASLASTSLWRLMATVLAISGTLLAADNKRPADKNAAGDKTVDKSSVNYNIPLWEEGKVPLATGNGPLDSPFLTVFLPPEGKRNGGSVIIAPGGSNIMLMYGGEGLDVAERYNAWGVTAFVLTYRLSPRYGENVRVMEGKRAVQLVRTRAGEFKLNPDRVGYIGFSAGSNTARSVVGTSGPGDPNAADPIERQSSRPDYLVLVYGVGRATQGESLKNFPPTFLISAAADTGPALGNAQLFMDLIRAGATAEIHVYQKGRHGFGSGFGSPEFSDWMGRLELFLKLGGFLPGAN
jgi:acetyl esterase/lipase